MNEKWVHTHTHKESTGLQSNTHWVFLQRKLVLINLAGGTPTCFSFYVMACSLSGSVEAINSGLSAVCLFEFFANLYYSLMGYWSYTGSTE